MGVPQGSVVAPLLFITLLHDIDLYFPKGNTVMLYADDLTIVSDNYTHYGSVSARYQHQALTTSLNF